MNYKRLWLTTTMPGYESLLRLSLDLHHLSIFHSCFMYQIILGDKARTNFDTDGSAVALVPAVPMTEPLRQEKLVSNYPLCSKLLDRTN